MASVRRRALLKFGAFWSATSLAGYGESNEGGLSANAWDPTPWLLFKAEQANVSLDLSLTLPTGIRPGGTFSLAATSGPLPSGMSLSAQGILTLANPIAGVTNNIVFAYAEPQACWAGGLLLC